LVLRRDTPWGNASRDDAISRAAGSHLWFMDDDDEAAPGALEVIRAAVEREPGRVHLFRMDDGGTLFWADPEARMGNVGTPMIVVPNDPDRLGSWGSVYEGDWAFLSTTLALHEQPAVFHDEVVAYVRPRPG
jgi:hypothetical protein